MIIYLLLLFSYYFLYYSLVVAVMPIIPPRPARSSAAASLATLATPEPNSPDTHTESTPEPLSSRKDTVDELLDYYDEETTDGAAPELLPHSGVVASEVEVPEGLSASSLSPPIIPSNRPQKKASVHEEPSEIDSTPSIPARPTKSLNEETPMIPLSRPRLKRESQEPEAVPSIPSSRPVKETSSEPQKQVNTESKDTKEDMETVEDISVQDPPLVIESVTVADEEVTSLPLALTDIGEKADYEPELKTTQLEAEPVILEEETPDINDASEISESQLLNSINPVSSKTEDVENKIELNDSSITKDTENQPSSVPIIPLSRPTKTVQKEQEGVSEEPRVSVDEPSTLIPNIPLARPQKATKKEPESVQDRADVVVDEVKTTAEELKSQSPIPSIPLDRPSKPVFNRSNTSTSTFASAEEPEKVDRESDTPSSIPNIPLVRPSKEFEASDQEDTTSQNQGIEEPSSLPLTPNIPLARPSKKVTLEDPVLNVEIPPRPVRTSSSDSSSSSTSQKKPPPPKPKHLSSKMAAFQQMFDAEPAPVETVKKAPKAPSRFANKLSGDKLKFAEGLRLGGGVVPLPGMANPALLQKLQARSSEADEEEGDNSEKKEVSNINETEEIPAPAPDARKSRVRPRGKRLPKSAQQAVEISSAPRFSVVEGSLWTLQYTKKPEPEPVVEEETHVSSDGDEYKRGVVEDGNPSLAQEIESNEAVQPDQVKEDDKDEPVDDVNENLANYESSADYNKEITSQEVSDVLPGTFDDKPLESEEVLLEREEVPLESEEVPSDNEKKESISEKVDEIEEVEGDKSSVIIQAISLDKNDPVADDTYELSPVEENVTVLETKLVADKDD